MSHGILNEIYFPRVDQACIRDFGLIVTDGRGLLLGRKTPLYLRESSDRTWSSSLELTNTCMRRPLPDRKGSADRSVAKCGVAENSLRAAPGQTLPITVCMRCWLRTWRILDMAIRVGSAIIKGTPMLFAQRDSSALALACSAPMPKRSVGFAGCLGRLAGPVATFPDDMGVRPRGKRKYRADR